MIKHPVSRFSIVPARAVEDRRLSAPAFRVLAALGTYSDKDGWCWPSMNTLARMLNCTRQAVQQHIRELTKLGYIEVQPQLRENRANTANRYRLLFDRALFIVGSELRGVQEELAGGVQGELAGPASPELATILKNAPREEVIDDLFAKHFEEFWRKYPSRSPHSNPKKPAKQKFETAVKRGVPVEAIIRGAENFAVYVAREGTDPRFIPQAVTWVNQERWDQYQKPLEEPVRELAPI